MEKFGPSLRNAMSATAAPRTVSISPPCSTNADVLQSTGPAGRKLSPTIKNVAVNEVTTTTRRSSRARALRLERRVNEAPRTNAAYKRLRAISDASVQLGLAPRATAPRTTTVTCETPSHARRSAGATVVRVRRTTSRRRESRAGTSITLRLTRSAAGARTRTCTGTGTRRARAATEAAATTEAAESAGGGHALRRRRDRRGLD